MEQASKPNKINKERKARKMSKQMCCMLTAGAVRSL